MGRGRSLASQQLVAAAYVILSKIQPASIRAVCYQLFIAGIITSMAKPETNKVSVQLTKAREMDEIPWSWIVDETREPERVSAWENPATFLETVKRSYRKDRWSDQPAWVEVWSEKGTIRGTLAPVLDAYGITLRVMHGYGSATAIRQAAVESANSRKPLTVLYVGDWDPSGLHMSDVDLPQRLEEYGGNVNLIRLALTKQDTYLADLPWFPADTKKGNEKKKGDSRYPWFLKRHGTRCWELDALNPVVLRDRLEQAVLERLDMAAWNRAAVTEAAEHESIASILSTWPSISGQASKYEAGT